MTAERRFEHALAVASLLFVLGSLLLVLGAAFQPTLVARFHLRSPLPSEALEETARTRLAFVVSGALLLVGAGLVRKEIGPARWLRRRGVTRLLVAATSALLPLFVLERGARPFVERRTTLFIADPDLGWRHQPGARDTYWGAWVRINSHGMRGPEREVEKRAGVRRVLVLGDSVVFGLSIEEDGRILTAGLERELAARAGGEFEGINAAVCGWSPWQQRLFLAREGERWQPDLVVLGFVLNDVTDRSGLPRIGGGLGAQLASSHWSRWQAESGLYLAMRELRDRLALRGDSAAALAHQDRLTPYHVILESDSDRVQAAWKGVLPEIEGIVAWCRARTIPVLLVVFPYALQVLQPQANAPQWILESFASRRDLPFLDLLPALVAARARDLSETDLFFDGLHPTPLGIEICAAEIARFVVDHALLH